MNESELGSETDIKRAVANVILSRIVIVSLLQ
jgi:hypothetical protein